ncbi:LysR family transcriptional regulator [Saccharopolyspora hattusasensis]|uniref:LysR family transcriptional regulator n=1 Tax=Saccharopolyspora hattusasensis TaxID=1128679 RepID=UPI003D98CB1B
MLDTQRLLTFEAVVRTGTFAAAARELGYTQPGVSQQMRALERELHTTLFAREGRGLRLSEQGEVLASRVTSLLSEIRSTEEHIAAVNRLRDGRVKVCAFPSANATLVPAAISKLRSNHLGIEIELFEAEPPDSLAGLRSGAYDIVVAFRYDDQEHQDDDDAVSIALLEEPLVLLLPDDHPLARRRQIQLADLREERWVAGCVRCRKAFLAACEDAGFTPRIDITTDDNLAVQSYVVSGLGLAAMPEMVQSFVRHPKLRIRPLLPERKRIVTATILKTNRRSPAVEHMLSSLLSAASDILANTDDT